MVIERSHRVRKYLILAFVFFLFAVAGFRFIGDLVDFPVYYHAGNSLLEGRTDLYAPDFAINEIMDYRYPSFFLVALIPLWMFPYPVAAYIWFLASVLMVFGCVIFVRPCRDIPTGLLLWLLVLFSVGPYFVMSLHYGNAHLLIVFLLFGAFYFVIRQHDFAGAILMALAITIKVIPILALPYFAAKRKWKFLALTLIFILVLNFFPALYFGFSANIQIFQDWFQHISGENAVFHEIHGAINQSLRGQLQRLLTDIDYSKRYDGDAGYPLINFVSFPVEIVNLVAWIIAILLYIAVCWFLWKRGIKSVEFESNTAVRKTSQNPYHSPTPSDFQLCISTGLEIGLILCTLLLFGPMTSRIYMIALLWPVFFLVQYGRYNQGIGSRIVLSTVVLTAIINTGAPLVPLITGQSPGQWSRLLLVLGTDFILSLMIFICVWMALLDSYRQDEFPEKEVTTS